MLRINCRSFIASGTDASQKHHILPTRCMMSVIKSLQQSLTILTKLGTIGDVTNDLQQTSPAFRKFRKLKLQNYSKAPHGNCYQILLARCNCATSSKQLHRSAYSVKRKTLKCVAKLSGLFIFLHLRTERMQGGKLSQR